MPSRLLKDLEPVTRELVSRLFTEMDRLGYPVRATCTLRSMEEQDALYAQGRTRPGKIVTNARAGMSPHNYGMAADLIFVNQGYGGPWKLLGSTAISIGLVWGGNFRSIQDRPHVERPNWRKYAVKKDTSSGPS